MSTNFYKFSRKAAEITGSAACFIVATISVIIWAIMGPLFGFSDTWMLWINTGTTIITFLMVFVIQNSQNHDTKALHIKLDELITAVEGARNSIAGIEDKSDRDIDAVKELHE